MTPTGSAVFGRAQHASTSSPLPRRDTMSAHDVYLGPTTVAVQQHRDWLHDVQVEIKEFLLLNAGWDGTVAEPISLRAVENSRRIIGALHQALPALKRPVVTPTIDGRVVIEWHSSEAHFDLDIGDADVLVFYEARSEGIEWEGPAPDVPINPEEFLIRYFQ